MTPASPAVVPNYRTGWSLGGGSVEPLVKAVNEAT